MCQNAWCGGYPTCCKKQREKSDTTTRQNIEKYFQVTGEILVKGCVVLYFFATNQDILT